MTNKKAADLATAFVEAFPEGSSVIVVYALPGGKPQVYSSLDSDRDTAAALRSVATNLSPAGDA